MISEVVWNLGGSGTHNNVRAKSFYERERGTYVYSGRPTTWTGKVGLMYPSDYGYATAGGATTNRDTCLNTVLYSWNRSSISDCKNNDWLSGNSNQCTITSFISYSHDVFYVDSTSYVYGSYVYNTSAVRPSVYLGSNIGIESGSDGSSTSPFVLKNS